jgi:hypothetical protein
MGWRVTRPEDREGWVRRKEINNNNILRSRPLTPAWLRPMLMVMMSLIKRFPNSLCSVWKNPGQDRWVYMEMIKS